jgi:Zn-dependent M28 family amino/carboxypeptidase
VLLNAHIDGFYQAAADNGSGAAAVLAAAQDLSDENPNAGLIFALYDGEEFGLLGSKVLGDALLSPSGFDVGDCGAPIAMAHLKAVVNLDASSARASDAQDVSQSLLETDVPLFSWRAIVYSEEPVLAAVGVAGFAAAGVLGLPLSVSIANEANGGIGRTDGKWFHEAGVPVIWPVAGYPEYHTDGDDLDAVDPADLEAVAAGAAEVTRRVAPLPVGRVVGAPALPATNPPPVAGCAPGSAAAGGGSTHGLETARIPATP